jgi:SAM-dependent methyltransferase
MTTSRDIYRVEQLPTLQNRMFPTQAAARQCQRGDMVLVQSLQTGLIFNQAFRPELLRYDQDYQNEQGLSARFREHLQSVAQVVKSHFEGLTLIEVGCGKGQFLEQLSALGFEVTGIDPSYEGSNPRVVKDFFTPALGLQAQGLVLRHVLEHVQDPLGFLRSLRESNGGTGRIYIEVPCLDWIASHRAWFDIFYEHVNYFRLDDFKRMFGTVFEAGHCFDGQYLYVVADLASLRPPIWQPALAFDLPSGFMQAIAGARSQLEAAAPGAARAVWGGASKGVIFTLLMERAGAPIETVIDINPAKQGRFLAATGLQVQSPEEGLARLKPGDDVYVMNSNYLDEIRAATADQFNYRLVEYEQI